MKQIILLSTVLVFTWLVIDGFMEENGLAPSPKKETRTPNTEGPQIFPGPNRKIRKKKLAPHKKLFVGRGSVYHGK